MNYICAECFTFIADLPACRNFHIRRWPAMKGITRARLISCQWIARRNRWSLSIGDGDIPMVLRQTNRRLSSLPFRPIQISKLDCAQYGHQVRLRCGMFLINGLAQPPAAPPRTIQAFTPHAILRRIPYYLALKRRIYSLRSPVMCLSVTSVTWSVSPGGLYRQHIAARDREGNVA